MGEFNMIISAIVEFRLFKIRWSEKEFAIFPRMPEIFVGESEIETGVELLSSWIQIPTKIN